MRPRTLAEVASRTADEPSRFADACNEFMDHFYLAHPDKEAQRAMLQEPPRILGRPFEDAWLAAMAEHLSQRWDLAVPGWLDRPGGNALSAPVFVPPSPAMRGYLIATSPPAFRSRLIFTANEPLLRARFPEDVAEIEIALSWPPKARDLSEP